MLSASATTSKPVAVDTDPTSITTAPQKFSNKFSFDTFDSPFHTPSLFVTNAPMKNTDAFNTFYTNADVFSHHGQFNQHQGPQYANQFSPDVYSIMADVESSGTRTPSPRVESLATTAVATTTTTTTATSNTAKDDPFKMEPPFLYHPQHQRKVTCEKPLVLTTTALIFLLHHTRMNCSFDLRLTISTLEAN